MTTTLFRSSTPVRALVGAAGLFVLVGASCGDPTGPDSFKLSFTGGVTLPRGKTTEVPITISHNGSVGTVTLAAADLPAGVTATFSKATIVDEDAGVTLSLTVASTAALGNDTLRITATGIDLDYETTMAVVISVKGDYTLTVNPAAVTAYVGESRTVEVSLINNNEFDQTVALSAGPREGITASFSPASIAGNAKSTVTISVASNAPTGGGGTYNIIGKTEGLADRTGVINLTVEQRPAVTLVVASSVSMTRGGTGSLGLSVNRVNYTGSVSVSIAGLPSGVSVSPNPIVVTSTNTIVQITVPASTPPGNYTLTISATADGLTIQPVTMTLTVLN